MEKTKRRRKPDAVEKFLALSPAEKEAYVAPFERGEIPLSESRPLNAGQRKLWKRVQRRLRGRPTVGAGAMVLSVSIERGLLKEADSFARRHKLKRSQMVAEGLRLLMQQRKAG
jgi:hypothetical protein